MSNEALEGKDMTRNYTDKEFRQLNETPAYVIEREAEKADQLMSPYQMAYPVEPEPLTKRERDLASTLHLLLSHYCFGQGVTIANSRAGITGQAIELLESIGYEVRG